MDDRILDPEFYKRISSHLGYGGMLEQWGLNKAMKDSGFTDLMGSLRKLNMKKQLESVNPMKQAEENQSSENILAKFITDNPYPKDDEVHEMAEEKGKKVDSVENAGYKLLSDFYAQGKRSKEPEKKLDSSQISKGVKVEKEHTTNPAMAKRIAEDHLTEIDDYYTRLDKMEEDAKKGKKASLAELAISYKCAGGPGSNSSSEVKLILDDFKDLKMSPITSIGKRKSFMEERTPIKKEVRIPLYKIKYVCQEKYIPEKLQKFVDNPDLLDIPVDVVLDSDNNYHILDGHHRFLASIKLKKDNILANVYRN